MFSKILIANRGEIACRVMRTAKRLGIATVAVYSEADADALHVELADESVCIGPAPSTESYLRIERIIQACRRTGVEAVHPGYGFLSENAEFAKALDKAGIVFIGPPADAMRTMGDKIASKNLAESAGVSTIPGSTEVVEDADHAETIARGIGYPVMLKASAGGGGKGMRLARDAASCREGFERATSEAMSSFGDGRVFIEKFIERPRHIEVQVLADSHGQVIHLGERECSIQRRHQKIIEESPSPFIDDATRGAMGEQAIALAKAVSYRSAGTVEFVVDSERNFYFLEMNTRLQVEHPVTEWVTGLDLVEQMIRIAAGEPLSIHQDAVRLEGSAVEARIYAEDPARNFSPSPGRITRYLPPDEADFVRVDSGVFQGSEVSAFYDPMIAKLVTRGETRAAAIARLGLALDRFIIRGVSSNLPFLSAIAANPRYKEGALSTDFVDEEFPEGFNPADVPESKRALLATVASVVHESYADRASRISGGMPGFYRRIPNAWVVRMGDHAAKIDLFFSDSAIEADCAGAVLKLETRWRVGEPRFEARVNGDPVCVQVEKRGVRYRLIHAGIDVSCLVLTPRAAELFRHVPERRDQDTSRYLLSPMPGLLVRLAVSPGDRVAGGQELAVVEAMKMENVLRADKERTVAALLSKPGDSLAADQPIIEFE
ncbi:MAG TPA: acetyl/propionyl/methylcrotonyl-CoA carboxylase subunit alpha [Gammaproteobacteria bacterium]|nr:acetyl/propionyl/methylcrotonyl-CoA carboxylase subunit alpha [Gammaproteobacteria bacterium]